MDLEQSGGAPVNELLSAVEFAANEYRKSYRLNRDDGWYMMLPTWIVYRDTYEAFCAEFIASMKRLAGMPFGHLKGFETVDPEGNNVRFTLPWETK